MMHLTIESVRYQVFKVLWSMQIPLKNVEHNCRKLQEVLEGERVFQPAA